MLIELWCTSSLINDLMIIEQCHNVVECDATACVNSLILLCMNMHMHTMNVNVYANRLDRT